MADQTGWSESGTADDGVATATKDADAKRQHVVYSVDASFAATGIALLEIKQGSTVKWSGHVHNQREVTFPKGLTFDKNTAVNAVLASGGDVGFVNVHGISRG